MRNTSDPEAYLPVLPFSRLRSDFFKQAQRSEEIPAPVAMRLLHIPAKLQAFVVSFRGVQISINCVCKSREIETGRKSCYDWMEGCLGLEIKGRRLSSLADYET